MSREEKPLSNNENNGTKKNKNDKPKNHEGNKASNDENNGPKKNLNEKPKKFLTDYFPPKSTPAQDMAFDKLPMISQQVLTEIDSKKMPIGLVKELRDQYWRMLAEEKRLELEEALAENERLFKIKEELIRKNKNFREMLEEAKTFITVFEEVVDNPADDTGIGLAESEEDNDED